jgi:hypothetical protein
MGFPRATFLALWLSLVKQASDIHHRRHLRWTDHTLAGTVRYGTQTFR